MNALIAASRFSLVETAQVAGQLLGTPPLQHRLQHLLLGPQQLRPARQVPPYRNLAPALSRPIPVTLRRLHQRKESFIR